jgi:hypothetical protein
MSNITADEAEKYMWYVSVTDAEEWIRMEEMLKEASGFGDSTIEFPCPDFIPRPAKSMSAHLARLVINAVEGRGGKVLFIRRKKLSDDGQILGKPEWWPPKHKRYAHLRKEYATPDQRAKVAAILQDEEDARTQPRLF